MTTPSLLWIVPEISAFQSGGNLYNQRLIGALKEMGGGIDILDADEFRLRSNSIKADVVFLDSLYLNHPALFVAARAFPTYFIVHHLESMFPPMAYDSELFFEVFEKEKLKPCAGFLVASNFSKRYLERYFPKHRYLEVAPGLSFPLQRRQKSASPLRALLVGNLIKRKGLLPFLEQLPERLDSGLEIRIVGSAMHERAYARKCLQLVEKLRYVSYLGEIPYDEMPAQYAWANLLVSCSFMETFGMGMQEAVAAGIPILAMDRGNAAQHVEVGNNGDLVDSMESLTRQLLALSHQPQKMESLLQNATLFNPWENYTWASAAANLLKDLSKYD